MAGLVLGAVAGLELGAVAGDACAAEPVTVAVGNEGLGAAPLIVASEGLHFSPASLGVRLDYAPNDETAEQEVAEGRADFGAVRLSGGFIAYAAAHDLRILAPEYVDRTGFPSTALVVSRVASAAGLHGPRNLAHRRVGLLSLDAPARFALVQSAARYGVPPAAIQFVRTNDETQLQSALATGALDAAIVPYATARAWRAQSQDLTIVRLSDFVQWQEGVVFARAAALRNDGGKAVAFMRAYRAAVADYDLTFQQRDDEGTALPGAHFGFYLAAIAAKTGIKPSEAAYALPFCDRLARLDTDDLGRQLAFWQELGLVGREVTVSGLSDTSLNPDHFSKM